MGLGYSTPVRIDVCSPARRVINELIASNPIIIFSKSGCVYCKRAKGVFDLLQHKYTVVELDLRDDGVCIQEELGEMTGANTVPRVFIRGECVGGSTEVKKLYDSGKLEEMLKEIEK